MPRKRKGERADGLIQVIADVGRYDDGRRRRKTFYGKTRAEAERKRDEYMRAIGVSDSFRRDMTVEEWVQFYKGTYRTNVNPAYLKSDDVPYNRLVKALGPKRLSSVTEADLQRALNQVSGMSYSTVDKYRQAIKRVFERARKNKLIADNPAEDLVMPKSVRGTHRALDPWEVELILKHWNREGLTAGLWIMIMLLCGLRRGEMMALDWSAVDLTHRTLEVRQVAVIRSNKAVIEQRAKTDAGLRTIPICQPLFDALTEVPPEKRSGLVCLSADGSPLTETTVSRGVDMFCVAIERIINNEPPFQWGRRNDLRDPSSSSPSWQSFRFQMHDLRHTFATFLYDAGVPVKAAQYFLGHSDVRITMDLYTHLSREREQASRNQVVAYLDRWLDRRVVTQNPLIPTPADLP